MVNTLGGIVGVLILIGAVGLIITRGPRHMQVRGKLWKMIGIAVLVLAVIGYLRLHDVRN